MLAVFHPKKLGLYMRNLVFISLFGVLTHLDYVPLSNVIYRQQDEELDELSASVERIGGVGLTIHEELLAQVYFVARAAS